MEFHINAADSAEVQETVGGSKVAEVVGASLALQIYLFLIA